jgi:GT2 family glycosyltransferase
MLGLEMNFSETTNSTAAVTVSLVSHGHGQMLVDILGDLADIPQVAHVILTLNVPEPMPVIPANLGQKMTVVSNSISKGFGTNHNAAFAHCETPFFCVLNPDVRLQMNPFPTLLGALGQFNSALAAPLVVTSPGAVEDSVRHFPTIFSLVRKAFGIDDGRYCYPPGCDTFPVDWVGGMFMLFKTDDYRRLNGFDEGFFLYYEDVDICARLWKAGGMVLACPGAVVIHDAQRTSRRKVRYVLWHIHSMMRYFTKHWLRLPRTSKAP